MPPATAVVLSGDRTALPRELQVFRGNLGCGWWPVGNAEVGQGNDVGHAAVCGQLRQGKSAHSYLNPEPTSHRTTKFYLVIFSALRVLGAQHSSLCFFFCV